MSLTSFMSLTQSTGVWSRSLRFFSETDLECHLLTKNGTEVQF